MSGSEVNSWLNWVIWWSRARLQLIGLLVSTLIVSRVFIWLSGINNLQTTGLWRDTFKLWLSTISVCDIRSDISTGRHIKSINVLLELLYDTYEHVAPRQHGNVFAATKFTSDKKLYNILSRLWRLLISKLETTNVTENVFSEQRF